MQDLVRVNNLGIVFQTPAGPVNAVQDISFRIRQGSCVAIVGESGSGKSVTARALLGILPKSARITQGEMWFNDPSLESGPIDLAKIDPACDQYREIRGGQISIIFQEPMTSLSPLHSIGNQISEALELHSDLTGKQAESRCIEMLKLVRFPDPDRSYRSYPFELSGGLRQRAMIAMALVCGPVLLIADEPTTALDVTVQAQILGLIGDLQSDLNMAVLIITHDMGVVANVAEEVVVVHRGEVMESGTVEDVIGNPQHDYLRALMEAVPTIDPDRPKKLNPVHKIEPKFGHLIAPRDNAKSKPQGPTTLMEIKELTKTFAVRRDALSFAKKNAGQKLIAVDRVSLNIERGECLALVGESGCGKTTVSKLIMGAMNPDSGQIIFHDHDNDTKTDFVDLNDRQLVPFRRRIQYIFQDPFGSLNPRMTVYDILSEPLVVHQIGDLAYRQEFVKELMSLVGLDPRYLNRYPHSFSGGQRQRIGIARTLVLRPEFIICDEPVSALDVSTQAQVLNLLKDLQKRLGLTFLFISHDLAVVNYVADRIAVMCRGRLVEVGPRAEIFKSPQHPYTKALLASVPTPDLAHPLDFSAIRGGLMTDPGNWPLPFGADQGGEPSLIDLGGGHLVRAFEAPTADTAA